MHKNSNTQFQYCSLDVVAKGILDPLSAKTLSSDEAQKIQAESHHLAFCAFEKGMEEHRALAERLLYLIHATTAFSPPLDEVSGHIWRILMKAKLNHELKAVNMEFVTPEQFRAAFQKASDEAELYDHTLVEEIGNLGDIEKMRRYVKNYLSSTGGFTHQLFAITKTSTGKLKRVLVNNLEDEFSQGKEHRAMRYLWPRQLGVEIVAHEAVRDPHYLTESFSVQNFRTLASLLPNPLLGTGMFFSVEALFAGLCLKLRPALVKLGVDEKHLEHLDIHSEADVDHFDEGVSAICETVTDGRDLAQVLTGAVVQMQLRHQMFTALRRDLLPKSLEKAA